jgi:hypothetical protein
MDYFVHLPFCSNAELGILPLGNNRVGVRFFMARVLMKILETKEVEGRKEGRKEGGNCGKLEKSESLQIACFIKHYRDEKMKEGETAGACRKHGKADKCVQIAFGRYKTDFEGSSSCCEHLTKYKKQNKF